jgi:t-SNARE complex subunit (syntaxin)
MRKFKLGHKEEELKKEEISSYKNFGKVVTNYDKAIQSIHKKPLYKQPRTFIILLLIIMAAILLSELRDKVPNDPTEPSEQQVD